MEAWGADLYGQPCRACGWSWETEPADALAYVRGLPGVIEALMAGRTGQERGAGLAWSSGEYVCHVGDNLRLWAERVAGRLAGDDGVVGGYDPDELARARRYEQVRLAAALWSLRRAAEDWVAVMELALARGLVLTHATRGAQAAADVARNNAHDAHHHVWDIGRCLAGGGPVATAP
ncbi:hypothetical protein [Actinotalea fermentans]|uniref:DinB-like domain-containing protein n=1 Tax=Actinotalea fermentans TaxID=43671 RepID=A0A511YZU1_9CELL|nr:hypothetical protein [Actinotalea fermentans]KGM16965.1 hypothetical protein N867_12515 [Actinotalea fermentans ATCC 43279 = JCM 9966 = DSM 3133]GEN80699.1 hypothetical protein AFE02nite_24330 [Actinotalea fermentans]